MNHLFPAATAQYPVRIMSVQSSRRGLPTLFHCSVSLVSYLIHFRLFFSCEGSSPEGTLRWKKLNRVTVERGKNSATTSVSCWERGVALRGEQGRQYVFMVQNTGAHVCVMLHRVACGAGKGSRMSYQNGT